MAVEYPLRTYGYSENSKKIEEYINTKVKEAFFTEDQINEGFRYVQIDNNQIKHDLEINETIIREILLPCGGSTNGIIMIKRAYNVIRNTSDKVFYVA